MLSAGRLLRTASWLSIPGAALFGCVAHAEKKPGAPPPREVEVLTISPSEVRDTGEYLGNVLSRHNVSILPQVSGYVKRILVKPGQQVKAGDTLVELDSRQERAALESVDAQARAAAAAEDLALRTFSRTQALKKEGVASGQELDQAEAQAARSKAERKAASARAAEQRVAVGFHMVKAPFAGTIGDMVVRLGDYVSASTQLTSITQGTTLEVEIHVPPERARLAHPGTPVELLDADGKLGLKTSVYFVAPEADPKTQLVDLNAIFPNEIGLKPSEMVRVRVIYGTRQALQVPVLAIVRQSGQAFVFGVEDKPSGPVVARRPVTLGVLAEQSYVVEKGLVTGDRIAVSSLQLLRDGTPIIPKAVVPPAAAAAKAP